MTLYCTTIDWLNSFMAFERELENTENSKDNPPRPFLEGRESERVGLPVSANVPKER